MEIIIFSYITFAILITLFYAILILYYMLGWQTISKFKASGRESKTKITVVVAARNEQDNILTLLTCLQNQSYPKELFEVIIVNDHSSDLTPELVENFEMSNLYLIHLSQFVDKNEIAFKKRAVETAIKQSIGELIVTTDADCTMGSNWLYQIGQFYEETGSKFIVAPVDYSPLNTFLDRIQALDFLSMMGVTGASVQHKLFNLSNGANMAYERAAFLKVNGYDKLNQSVSGDDVFLIEKIGKEYPHDVQYLKNYDAVVFTKPCKNFAQLFQQRMRWISKTKHYTDRRTKILALLILAFHMALFFSLGLSFVNKGFISLFLMHFMVKVMVDFALVEEVSRFFKKEKLLYLVPIVEVFHLPFTFLVAICSQFFKYNWKGRKIKE